MKIFLTVFAIIALLGFPLSRPHAASCSYGSTQARVQNNITVPWVHSTTVGCERSFNVGSFHNGTGQFSGDTQLHVAGPNFSAYFRNGDTVRVHGDGLYTLTVTTPGQDGPACTEQATANIICSPPPPPTSTCNYSSTQARVQNNISTPWQPAITVGCERVFNVGSFHNGTGQFSNDTSLYVAGPGIGAYYTNGNTVRIPDHIPNGLYSLSVNTNYQAGNACSEVANVSFSCTPSAPTATPIPPQNGGVCSYSSTQARVQKDEQQPWNTSLNVTCNDTVRVGSFHNGSGQFATDTKIRIIDPFGFISDQAHNGSMIRTFFPGLYRIIVTTNNQTGPLCGEEAMVSVSCPSYPIPQIWISMLQQFMVGN